MITHERLMLTEEEIAILTFSVFAAYPRLYWENNMIWSSMWFEFQKSMIESKQEMTR